MCIKANKDALENAFIELVKNRSTNIEVIKNYNKFKGKKMVEIKKMKQSEDTNTTRLKRYRN